jgi:hypothetical protein
MDGGGVCDLDTSLQHRVNGTVLRQRKVDGVLDIFGGNVLAE